MLIQPGWKRPDSILSVLGVIATIACVAGLILCRRPIFHAAVIVAWVVWALAPPAWFLIEWSRFDGKAAGTDFDTLKYSQELASKFWIAGVGVLSATLYHFDSVPK